jgi:RecB family endonuclease NucS
MATPTDKKRPYRRIEKRLVSDFVRDRWPGASVWDRIRLGPYKSPTFGTVEERMQQAAKIVKQRWADAIVFTGDELIIVEGKVIADANVAGQLKHYSKLIRETPEFEVYNDAPLRLVLVAAKVADDIRTFLQEEGIETVIYRPDWAEQYILERELR